MANLMDFPPASSHGYILNRSHLAACRLNLQHFLWRETLGFTIHPSIKLSPNSPVCIADVACGTSLWLLDARKEYPDAQLQGFDMDLSQAPHQNWLPPNIKLSKWNIFNDVPYEWEGKFDFVHVRLLLLVLSGIDPKPVLSRFYRLLRPGGYFQWDELDCFSMYLRKTSPTIATPASEELRKICYADGRHDWVLRIHEYMSEVGFEDAKMHRSDENGTMSRAFNDNHLFTMEEIATTLLRVGKEGEGMHIDGLIGKAYEEALEGVALCIPRVVCVGRRPV